MNQTDRKTYRMILCVGCHNRDEYECHAYDDDTENCMDVSMGF